MNRTKLKIPAEIYEKLEKQAEKQGCTVNEYIDLVINKRIELAKQKG